jgi:DNA-binding CsgD family transcriptional regulator
LNELSSATLMVDVQGRILYHTGPGRQWIGATNQDRLPGPISDWLDRCLATSAREVLRQSTVDGEIYIRAVPTSSPERLLLVLSKEKIRTPGIGSPSASGLSQRQREVARWIREGKTNAEIAMVMGISPRTVQKHIEHVFEKLGVKTRVAIATRTAD